MKRKNLISLMMLLILTALSACEKVVVEEPARKGTKATRVVTISPVEEQIQISETPMTRGSMAGKVYAVNVFQKTGKAKSYSKYAYGLFTDPSKIAVVMTEGSKYKIECLIVQDGDEAVYNNNGEYLAPFLHGQGLPTKAANVFVKSTTENLGRISRGTTNLSATDSIRCPKVSKQYCVVDDFDPASSDHVTLGMRRAVFGLHFKITPPEEGCLTVYYLSRTIDVKSSDPAYDKNSVYSFNIVDAAIAEGYHGDVTMKMKWKKDDGTVEEYSKKVTLKRNIITTIEISAKGPDPHSIGFSEESGALGEETVKWQVGK